MAANNESAPVLCRNCATFYGNAKFNNYCSKCYNQLFGSNAKPTMSTSDAPTITTEMSATSSPMAISSNSGTSSTLKPSQPIAIAKPAGSSNSLKVSSSLPVDHFMDIDSPTGSPSASPSSYGDGFLKKKAGQCSAAGCKKRLPLTAVECKCGYSFCSNHRYAEQHNCPFDYKGTKQKHLEAANPLVVPSKLTQI